MINKISPIYNVGYAKTPNFKAASTTSHIEQTTVNMNGLDAIAASNYAMVNKKDVLNIPTLTLPECPKSLDDIKGERICRSNGELVAIVDEDDNHRTVYEPDKDISGEWIRYNNLDKKTGLRNEGALKFDEGWLEYGQQVNKQEWISNGYKSGKLSVKSRNIDNPDGSYEYIDYFVKDNEYSISQKVNKNGEYIHSNINLDGNGNYLSSWESDFTYNDKRIEFYNGVPYKITTENTEVMPNDFGKDDIDLTNFEPHSRIEYDEKEINSLEGKKGYYSNGQIESITTNDGKIYTFDFDGKLKTVNDGNKLIKVRYDKNSIQSYNIKETLSDGTIKTTDFCLDSTYIEFENNNCHKSAEYDLNGNLIYYTEEKDGKVSNKRFSKEGYLVDSYKYTNDD